MNLIFGINRKSCSPNWLATISILFVISPMANGQPQVDHQENTATMVTTSIAFKGAANGGEMILAEALNRNMRTATICTNAGESAETVANRLAEYINKNNPFEWYIPKRYEGKLVTSEKGTLKGLPGMQLEYILAGTETGLGIPLPPYSLTCTVDTKGNLLLLSWENPPGVYDRIAIVYNWTNFDHTGSDVIEGNATSFARDLRPLDISDLDVWIMGLRNGILSNAGAIHVSGNGRVQEELFGIPFTNGIAPNWTTWVTAGDKNAVRFEKRVRDQFVHAKGRTSNRITHPATKPFFQVIKVASPTAVAGVKRKFLGLTPGHTYRISARLSTLELDSAKENWSFSLHAAYNAPGGADLAVEQLGGLAELPDGNKGGAAGRIALYEPGLTTNGTWEERSTGKEWRGLVAPDITLPRGVDTMTVWVRHRGVDSTGVGIDWVKIEDLSVLPNKSQR